MEACASASNARNVSNQIFARRSVDRVAAMWAVMETMVTGRIAFDKHGIGFGHDCTPCFFCSGRHSGSGAGAPPGMTSSDRVSIYRSVTQRVTGLMIVERARHGHMCLEVLNPAFCSARLGATLKAFGRRKSRFYFSVRNKYRHCVARIPTP